jgi:gamma-glutamyltranspeptidase
MGGDGQPQIHLQVYTAVARFELDIQAAIEMPRWIHGANGAESLHMESRFPPQTLQALHLRGHPVEELSAWETAMGYAQGITFDPSTGVMQGGADPRAESLAAAW